MNWNLPKIWNLAQQAIHMSLSTEKHDRHVKKDHSLVTEVDPQIENFLRTNLEDTQNNTYFIGEEFSQQSTQKYIDESLEHSCWIVDPIDGTMPFYYQLPQWGISIAYLEKYKVIEGMIILVSLGQVLFTDRGYVYHLDLGAFCRNWDLQGAQKIHWDHSGQEKWDCYAPLSVSQNYLKQNLFPISNPIQSDSCSVFSLTYFIKKSYLAYMARLCLWDFAATLPMLEILNAYICFPSGKQISSLVTPDIYQTQVNQSNFMRTKEMLIFSRNKTQAQYLSKMVEIHKKLLKK